MVGACVTLLLFVWPQTQTHVPWHVDCGLVAAFLKVTVGPAYRIQPTSMLGQGPRTVPYFFCRMRDTTKDKEDPKGTGRRYSMLYLVQPKNCNTKDPEEAKIEKKERSVPKKRYSHSHFACSKFEVYARFFHIYFHR